MTGTTVDHGPVTPGSKLIAAPRATADRPKQYLLARPHGAYSDDDVRTIVGHYYTTCPAVGLDPLLMVAQMTEETGHLTSFWSQRPRRNLAGIGVTGEPGVGLSFADLKIAVRAHVGRLLAYALPKGTGNQAQVQLIEEALAFRPLPDNRRGCAPTLAGLAGTYAADPATARPPVTRRAGQRRPRRRQAPETPRSNDAPSRSVWCGPLPVLMSGQVQSSPLQIPRPRSHAGI